MVYTRLFYRIAWVCSEYATRGNSKLGFAAHARCFIQKSKLQLGNCCSNEHFCLVILSFPPQQHYIYIHIQKKTGHISYIMANSMIYIYNHISYIMANSTIYVYIYIIIMCCGEANNKPSPIEVYCWVYSHYDDGNWPPVIVRGSPALQEGHCLSGVSHVEDEFPLTVGSKNGFDVLTHTVCLCKSMCDMSMYKI